MSSIVKRISKGDPYISNKPVENDYLISSKYTIKEKENKIMIRKMQSNGSQEGRRLHTIEESVNLYQTPENGRKMYFNYSSGIRNTGLSTYAKRPSPMRLINKF